MRVIKSIIPIVLMLILVFSSMGFVYAPNGDGIPSYDNNISTSDNGTNDAPVIIPIDPRLLFSGYLTVSVNPQIAHVGDMVYITITATNTGSVDWCPVEIYAPVPDGLQFLSFTAPGLNLQNYDPNTGIWYVYRMRYYERGQQKIGIITAKVLPEAAGRSIRVTARFNTLVLEGYSVHMENEITARHDNLDIVNTNTSIASFTATPISGPAPLTVHFHDTSTGNVTGYKWLFGTGGANDVQDANIPDPTWIYTKPGTYTVTETVSGPDGTSRPFTQTITVNNPGDDDKNGKDGMNGMYGINGMDGLGDGSDLSTLLGNTKLADAIKNLTASDENDPLLNLHKGGGGGKRYEITLNHPQTQDNSLALYILAILLIAGLLVTGYFYGIKRDR